MVIKMLNRLNTVNICEGGKDFNTFDRIEHYRTEQSRTEQKREEQNRKEQNRSGTYQIRISQSKSEQTGSEQNNRIQKKTIQYRRDCCYHRKMVVWRAHEAPLSETRERCRTTLLQLISRGFEYKMLPWKQASLPRVLCRCSCCTNRVRRCSGKSHTQVAYP